MRGMPSCDDRDGPPESPPAGPSARSKTTGAGRPGEDPCDESCTSDPRCLRRLIPVLIIGLITGIGSYDGVMAGNVATGVGQRPGLRAYEDSVRLGLPEVVARLREILGVRLVAYIGNVKSTQPVAAWASGVRSPGQDDADRLRCAFQIAGLLRERYSAVTVQSWFKGMNPALDDAAPARVLREGDPAQVGPGILAAAKSFAFLG